ncbi:OsmC family protein [Pengzhenrongella sicca]|uniref:OsmC family protein n=1 Tax=Pengzhenrongella sicca TaxID=2819238 RepID=A0A8A4ZJI6_9MICO|nr:OsmC family protein [Pengzhenrongella sicca]QTE31129.1 OsmC family protein [Pengzhenrongella sicca]
MGALHSYTVNVTWTGAGDTGTSSYTAYGRDHEVVIAGRPVILGSADPAFRGDTSRYSPEQLFVAALSECHMLWFLHQAANDGLVVVGYSDDAVGTMRVESAGAGQFTDVVMRPHVTVRVPAAEVDDADAADDRAVTDARLLTVHQRAHDHCFLSRSVNFPVLLEPTRFVTEH